MNLQTNRLHRRLRIRALRFKCLIILTRQFIFIAHIYQLGRARILSTKQSSRSTEKNGSFGTYDGASNAYQNGLFPHYGYAGSNAYVINWSSGHTAELSEEYIKIYDGYDKEIDYEINRSSGFLIWSANGFVLGVCQSSSNQIKGKLF